MNSKLNEKILEFWKKEIDKNAPLTINNDDLKSQLFEIDKNFIKTKYPYKPFLMIAIIKANQGNIFNEWIKVNDINVVKRFYDYISSDYYLFQIIKNQKSKEEWELGLNKSVTNHLFKSILNIIKQSSIRAFLKNSKEEKWFDSKENNNYIKLNINSLNPIQDKELLLSLCYKTIKKCIPWYKDLNNNDIDNYQFNIENELLTLGAASEFKNRKYQHLFRKNVLDRDEKCIICCISNNKILEACHIKPYRYCSNNEAYDFNNGITLCSNHHKLFDNGLFTFNDEWKIILSDSLEIEDINLTFKVYEPCFFELSQRMIHKNEYVHFHSKNIYKK